MKTVIVKAAALALAATLLGACGIEKVLEPAADVTARIIDEGCESGTSDFALEGRKEFVAEVNSRTEVGNYTPSDCDSDGLPDFEIDANGMPVEDGAALPPGS